jgi:hypothetical protein
VVKKLSRTTTAGYNGTWDDIENPDFPSDARWRRRWDRHAGHQDARALCVSFYSHGNCCCPSLWGGINDEQPKLNEYQRTVIQVLLEKMGKKRILLNDDQGRRLAVKGKILGRKILAQVGALFTPDTILRWHRELVAQKWDHSDQRRKVGRPPTAQQVIDLIL